MLKNYHAWRRQWWFWGILIRSRLGWLLRLWFRYEDTVDGWWGSSRQWERSMLVLYVGYRCSCWLWENGPEEEEWWFSRQLAENKGSIRWQEALVVTWRFEVAEMLIVGSWIGWWELRPWDVLTRGRKWINGRDVAWEREGNKKNSKEFLWYLKRKERKENW